MNKNPLLSVLAFFVLAVFILSGCHSDSFTSEQNEIQNPSLEVSFIDVGQGDSTLITCDGETMLIDAGIYSERQSLSSYLRSQGIKNLDYCVATHSHSDHIGGMSHVLYNFTPETLIYPAYKSDSADWYSLLDVCDELGIDYSTPEPGNTFTVGKAKVTVLSPYKNANYDNLNNQSLVLRLDYENTSFLFTGDAEKQVEKELLESNFYLEADVLKCGHHGSSTSSIKAFVDRVNPSAAVISCGKNNDYNHPHIETINILKSKDIEIYRTDLSSTIVARSDGNTISFSTHTNTETSTYNYIGNKNSKVYHSPYCNALSTMNAKNKVYFHTADEAELEGYTPCQNCKP